MFILVYFLAQNQAFMRKLDMWKDRAIWAVTQPDPLLPDKKVFKAKHQLPPITDYTTNPGPDFWAQFPSNKITVGKSTICPHKLRNLAWAVGYNNNELLDKVCKDLENGADIRCKGAARSPTISSNAPSALEFKEQVTDAVADWVAAGFAAGPFSPSDRPAASKVNGMMCRQKPNGSARIILNFSAPKGNCVNDGISNEDFPTTMSSTKKWLEVLDKAGKGALMAKLDWASAYKHIAVRQEDIHLQFFNWLGMDFVELCLVFGCRSSAGLYDRLAKLVLALVLLYCKFPCRHGLSISRRRLRGRICWFYRLTQLSTSLQVCCTTPWRATSTHYGSGQSVRTHYQRCCARRLLRHGSLDLEDSDRETCAAIKPNQGSAVSG
jgi:hypothetical protein